jgi:hypothetical protein
MGLLSKAITTKPGVIPVSGAIKAVIANFHHRNPLFHCIVLQFKDDQQQGLADIAAMTASHGVDCCGLSRGNGLVLLPGNLDMELFSHQLSQSTGSTVLFQFSANATPLAFDTLSPYL